MVRCNSLQVLFFFFVHPEEAGLKGGGFYGGGSGGRGLYDFRKRGSTYVSYNNISNKKCQKIFA